jgi:hypothetical protein
MRGELEAVLQQVRDHHRQWRWPVRPPAAFARTVYGSLSTQPGTPNTSSSAYSQGLPDQHTDGHIRSCPPAALHDETSGSAAGLDRRHLESQRWIDWWSGRQRQQRKRNGPCASARRVIVTTTAMTSRTLCTRAS